MTCRLRPEGGHVHINQKAPTLWMLHVNRNILKYLLIVDDAVLLVICFDARELHHEVHEVRAAFLTLQRQRHQTLKTKTQHSEVSETILCSSSIIGYRHVETDLVDHLDLSEGEPVQPVHLHHVALPMGLRQLDGHKRRRKRGRRKRGRRKGAGKRERESGLLNNTKKTRECETDRDRCSGHSVGGGWCANSSTNHAQTHVPAANPASPLTHTHAQ